MHQEVTVFILTHERSDYLKEMIDSVLKQTYPDFQLLIIDDSSSKATEKMVFTLQDDRILYLRLKCNTVCDKLYFANQICNTKYLIMFHDDDIVEPNYLTEMISVINNSNCDAVSCVYRQIDEMGKAKTRDKEVGGSGGLNIYKDSDYLTAYLSETHISMNFPATIYRKDFYYKFYEDLRPFPFNEIGPCIDQWIWFESCRRGGSIGIYDKALYYYRIHDGQDGGINSGKMELQFINYLLNDTYYSRLISKNRINLCKRVLVVFKIITKRFYEGDITADWYRIQFSSPAYKRLMTSFTGTLYAAMIWMAYTLGRIKIRRHGGTSS